MVWPDLGNLLNPRYTVHTIILVVANNLGEMAWLSQLSQKPSNKNRQFRVSVLGLAWFRTNQVWAKSSTAFNLRLVNIY